MLSGNSFVLSACLSERIKYCSVGVTKSFKLLQSAISNKFQKTLACWMFRESLIIINLNECEVAETLLSLILVHQEVVTWFLEWCFNYIWVILKNVGHFLLRSIATPGQRCDFASKNKKKEGHKWKKPANIGKIYTLFENFVLYWIITPN